jgi:hypothetical protein
MEREGVFISHIADEGPVAIALKDFLREAFADNLKVFVSSDYESITSGEEWFRAIVEAIKSARIVLVLLSPMSVNRRWINFESGVGLGASVQTIPIVFSTSARVTWASLYLRCRSGNCMTRAGQDLYRVKVKPGLSAQRQRP